MPLSSSMVVHVVQTFSFYLRQGERQRQNFKSNQDARHVISSQNTTSAIAPNFICIVPVTIFNQFVLNIFVIFNDVR